MKMPSLSKTYLSVLFFVGAVLVAQMNVYAIDMAIQGRLSGWTNQAQIQDKWENHTGVLYIPQVDFIKNLDRDTLVDSEFSLFCFAVTGSGPFEDELDLDLYRANIRYRTTQTETRMGLQKINFGQATLLRPLRWFDRVNPTDPLQITEGVYALKFRYDALNNANLRFWGLYDNDDIKGYERFPTKKNSLEVGARFQYPVLNGDMAVTLHSRRVDGSVSQIPNYMENRFGLDGRWDMGIGLWFEAAFTHEKSTHRPNDWTKRSTVGLDYTFEMGNGLTALAEHMNVTQSDEMFKWGKTDDISALSMSYPIGMMDNVKAIGYYFWDQDKFSLYLDWTRTYDSVMINTGLFYFPEMETTAAGIIQDSRTSGSGGRILITFNH